MKRACKKLNTNTVEQNASSIRPLKINFVRMNTNEIVIYQPDNNIAQFEVRLENDTVWLTQAQMVTLFESTKQNISLHINNGFNEGELNFNSTVKEYLTVQMEGKRKVQRKIAYYNLDVIISVGYVAEQMIQLYKWILKEGEKPEFVY